MDRFKKILPIILGIGLTQGCFALTGAAQTAVVEQNYQVNKNEDKKTYTVQFEHGYKYNVYGSGATETEEVKKRREFTHCFALYILTKQALLESNNVEIKNNLDFYLDFLASGKFTNAEDKTISSIVSSGEKSDLKSVVAFELKRLLTVENLGRFEITEQNFYEARQNLAGKIQFEISKFTNLNKMDIVKILQDNLNEVNNADFVSVKSAKNNITKCEIKIFENKPVEVKA